MFILNFLMTLLFISVLLVMVCTIIKFTMMVVMRYNYNNNILIIPAILNTIIWLGLFTLWYLIITKLLNVDILTILFNNILNIENQYINIIPLILITLGFIIIGIVAQAFSYTLINISYKDSFGKVRMNLKELIRKLLKKSEKMNSLKENSLSDFNDIPKIKFTTALIASTFSFAMLICTFLILFFVGNVLSTKLILT